MSHDWVIDVLTDLRRFADRNGLPRLAMQLQESALLAAMEIAARPQSQTGGGGDLLFGPHPVAFDRGD
jgi:hypothetical protein